MARCVFRRDRKIMARSTQTEISVTFGDCDPAGIVFFPNFSRWMDAASLRFFMLCGVPPWHRLVLDNGIIGTPLLEIHTKFVKSATYGETLQIETSIETWNAKAFVQKHVVMRGDDLICEGRETRIFAVRDKETGRLRGIEVPPEIRALCT
jgi:4-hydroxybenzoyl-CoA thioesterase